MGIVHGRPEARSGGFGPHHKGLVAPTRCIDGDQISYLQGEVDAGSPFEEIRKDVELQDGDAKVPSAMPKRRTRTVQLRSDARLRLCGHVDEGAPCAFIEGSVYSDPGGLLLRPSMGYHMRSGHDTKKDVDRSYLVGSQMYVGPFALCNLLDIAHWHCSTMSDDAADAVYWRTRGVTSQSVSLTRKRTWQVDNRVRGLRGRRRVQTVQAGDGPQPLLRRIGRYWYERLTELGCSA